MMQDLPVLLQHPGVTAEQHRDLAIVVFEEIRFRDGRLTAVKPQPQYAPLFAYALCSAAVGGVSARPELVEGPGAAILDQAV